VSDENETSGLPVKPMDGKSGTGRTEMEFSLTQKGTMVTEPGSLGQETRGFVPDTVPLFVSHAPGPRGNEPEKGFIIPEFQAVSPLKFEPRVTQPECFPAPSLKPQGALEQGVVDLFPGQPRQGRQNVAQVPTAIRFYGFCKSECAHGFTGDGLVTRS